MDGGWAWKFLLMIGCFYYEYFILSSSSLGKRSRIIKKSIQKKSMLIAARENVDHNAFLLT